MQIATLFLLLLFAIGMGACGDSSSDHPEKPDSTGKKADPHAGEKGKEHAEEGHDHAKEGHDEHGPDEQGHEEGEGHDEHEGEITMTPAAIKEAGIVVEPVIKQGVSSSVTAPGRVVPTQSGVAHVGTVIPGRISRLFVSEGSRVGKGTPLAEIEALDIGAVKGEYVTARASLEHTRSTLARQEKLSKEGIGARKALEEARASNSQALASLRTAESKLRAAGINPSSVSSSGSFSSRITIRSPINGVVSRRSVVIGEYLEPSKDAFEVVNTSTVWVDAQVTPDVAATLQVGGVGFIRDRDDHRHTGAVRFISPTVDPESRTVTVRTEVTNADVHMRPETFVTVEFERSVSGFAVAVPTEAIEQEGSIYYVYREHEPGSFQRVPVQVGSEAGEKRVVTGGLKEGDRIATKGLFYLKSARQKGELQEHKH